ncbi:hypothetical protein CR47_0212155 [Ralstonia solanacearum]|nr:hypothetical protein CQ06_02560 [Ralstonia solanacearum]KFX80699.1 hypothetical protein KR98_02650 [Ralstonia solanacearum]KFX83767.1 hypothetical protein KR99_10280 [Ralstonia solanacearum]KFZ93900.1 hypothetical protein CR47_0212155 [Ralstonia solanacearum]OCQ57626.1 hypothetical protein AR463_01075 [Ralstonia solanacearum]
MLYVWRDFLHHKGSELSGLFLGNDFAFTDSKLLGSMFKAFLDCALQGSASPSIQDDRQGIVRRCSMLFLVETFAPHQRSKFFFADLGSHLHGKPFSINWIDGINLILVGTHIHIT